MKEHIESVFHRFQDQIMYFSKEKKIEEQKKAAEKKTGENSKKRADKALLKLFGAKFDEES